VHTQRPFCLNVLRLQPPFALLSLKFWVWSIIPEDFAPIFPPVATKMPNISNNNVASLNMIILFRYTKHCVVSSVPYKGSNLYLQLSLCCDLLSLVFYIPCKTSPFIWNIFFYRPHSSLFEKLEISIYYL